LATSRISYGAGAIIAILAPFVIYFLKLQDLGLTFFEVFALLGLWTLVCSFFFDEERKMYLVIGILLAFISSVFVISITYAIALIIVAVIIDVVVVSATRDK
jgi:hypothetical protein